MAAIARYLQPWVDASQPLLELGAGYGEFTREIRASSKWALDQNPALAEHWDPSVQALFQSALDPWAIPDASLGTVFASNFLEHFTLEDGAQILKQVQRKLRPGGRFIAIQPNFRLEPRRYFDDYTHRTAYTDAGFQDFLRSLGWRVEHAEPRFTSVHHEVAHADRGVAGKPLYLLCRTGLWQASSWSWPLVNESSGATWA